MADVLWRLQTGTAIGRASFRCTSSGLAAAAWSSCGIGGSDFVRTRRSSGRVVQSTSNDLTDLQVEVLRMLFSMPDSDGFMLAGGAGLGAG